MIDQKQTQCKRIIDYIRANGHITSLEAAKHLNITQLCARISDLESRGFVFNKPKFKVGIARIQSRIIRLPSLGLSCGTWKRRNGKRRNGNDD